MEDDDPAPRADGPPAGDARLKLRLLRARIDTHDECVAFVPQDAVLCLCTGLHALDRIEVKAGRKELHAVLNSVDAAWAEPDAIHLSEHAFRKLGVPEGTLVEVHPAEPPTSLVDLHEKMTGVPLDAAAMKRIVRDIVDARYTKTETTAFVTSVAIHGLDDDEIVHLIHAMVESGERLHFDAPIVADKHSIGGLPGNRTTPIVTSIVAAAGLTMPKTSSRAITSPAGTADAMETLMDVELPLARLQEVVAKTSACLAWGGALNLAPADDLLIRVERPLSIDAEGLMIASILAKKKAAGSTHVLLDIPVGPGTKAATRERAVHIQERFERIAKRLHLHASVLLTPAIGPIGRGVGPALEARDVMQILERSDKAPADLEAKSILLAGELLALCGKASRERAADTAAEILRSGKALAKFQDIRRAQGAREPPPPGRAVHEVHARAAGTIQRVDAALVARLARLAGAPRDASAGVDVLRTVGDSVRAGEAILRIHATNQDALRFAVEHARRHGSTHEIR